MSGECESRVLAWMCSEEMPFKHPSWVYDSGPGGREGAFGAGVLTVARREESS